MGSHSMLKAPTARLIGSVQSANERMDSVQAGGMLRRVPGKAASTYMRQRYARNTGRVDGRVEKYHFPPPPHRSDAGATHNFSHAFMGICKLAN